ncbi:GNAT family N-acetyltransferase [Aerococcus kribbianus]|uniref:GNAT family N-acetyltransferase n=1 Tax=Aerococcus kribbianus TaxID=2999064 RepID=A0A9X3FSS4_9LACT|nr:MULTISPECIES: GNAT family N-acetyltransferase [unclassified Aerococcus]MCZ0717737.1 GNAT family N-acetyltransferase [Aerococcus sp. YH-aer221]MCZ0726025.1 GNAT family N-acetyltransferase [Aerococcus sp. YH-aer222]
MNIIWTTDLNSEAYQDSLAIRRQVFIDEQGVAEAIEIDKNEEDCYHVVGYENGTALATARLLAKTPTDVKLQRVAVLKDWRQQGYGRDIVFSALEKAREEKFSTVILGAQMKAIPFYQNLGFELDDSEPYKEAGILHRDMIYKLYQDQD